MLVAVTIAFSGVTDVQTSGVPYAVFALVGLTVWTFVQNALMVGTLAIVSNAQLVRRSPLPGLLSWRAPWWATYRRSSSCSSSASPPPRSRAISASRL